MLENHTCRENCSACNFCGIISEERPFLLKRTAIVNVCDHRMHVIHILLFTFLIQQEYLLKQGCIILHLSACHIQANIVIQ